MQYENPTIAQTLLISLVGFAVVFSVLVILMTIIVVMSKLMGVGAKSAPVATVPAPAPVAAPTGLLLENISEKDAALVMAIVAEEMGKDPAELEFISIKEVKE